MNISTLRDWGLVYHPPIALKLFFQKSEKHSKNNQILDQINFIDYEYADANYQLFDIANHFCEYAGVDEPNYSLCPTKTEKFKFLEIYFSYFYDKKVDQSKIEQTLKILPFFEAVSGFIPLFFVITFLRLPTFSGQFGPLYNLPIPPLTLII